MLNEEVAKVIGENVRRYRKEKGYTQERLAEEANIDRTAISKLEKGKFYWINIFFYRSITYKNRFANYVKLCYNKFVTILES